MDKIENSGMDALAAITTRRSIRKYTSEPITDGELNTVLNAGFHAPSAHNFRPWEFIVIKEKSTLREIAENGKYMKMVAGADAGILICGDTAKMNVHDFLINDCSAAAQNILLAAHSIGLGAVWCGISKSKGNLAEFFSGLLDIPEHILPVAFISLGHTEEAPNTSENRFDSSKLHFEKF